MPPQVSIIIPCYNEERHIRECLESIVANDYPKDMLEVLVIDGRSDDGSKGIIEEFTKNYPFIRRLDNPKRIVPVALNLGIIEARGEIVLRMDAHNTYPRDYITKLVYWLEESSADNVGGIWITRPGADTYVAGSIALALSSTFGVGNARFRTTTADKKPQYVDTVPFGAYRKKVFERVGLFDERLVRNQDIEFNKRLINSGGKILLVPEIISYYHARPTLRALWWNNFTNGLWVISSAWLTNDLKRASFRHFVPLGFISGLFGSIIITPFVYYGEILIIAIVGSYLSLALFFSGKIALNNGIKYFPIMPSTFFALHLSYGLGSLWGITKVLSKKLIGYFF